MALDPTEMLAAFEQRLGSGNPDAAAAASPTAQAAGPAGVAAQATAPLTDQPLTADYMSGGASVGGTGGDGGNVLARLPDRSGKRTKGSGSTGSGAGLNDMLAAFSKSSEASPDPWQAFSNGLSSGLSGISESRSASAKSSQDSIDKRFNQLQKLLEYNRNLKKDEEAARHNRASEANDATSKKAYRDSVAKQGKGKDGPTEIQIREALRKERAALEKRYELDDVTLTPEQKAAKRAQIDTEMKGVEQSIRGGKQEDAEGGAGGVPMTSQPGRTLPRRDGDGTAPTPMQPSGPVTPGDQNNDELSGASFTPDAQQSAAARPPRDQVISDARNALARGAPRDQVFAGMTRFGVDPSELDPPSNNQPSAPAQEQQGGGIPWARMLEALTGNAGASF
jgi:hypothetical protein